MFLLLLTIAVGAVIAAETAFFGYPGTDEDKALVRQDIESKSHLVTEYFGAPAI